MASINLKIAAINALSTAVWYKRDFKNLVNLCFPNALNFEINLDKTKREVSEFLIQRISDTNYNELIIGLNKLSEIEPNKFYQNYQGVDKDRKIHQAKINLSELKKELKSHQSTISRESIRQEEINRQYSLKKKRENFEYNLLILKEKFLRLQNLTNHQQRGIEFETFLTQLFDLFSLEPNFSYSLKTEQIDGSFAFDTDNYIVEAKWHNRSIGREIADTFKAKIERRSRNTLGLLVSINGFSTDLIETYKYASPFMTLNGSEIFNVLEGHLSLIEIFSNKKRILNDTGSCFSEIIYNKIDIK